MLLDTSAIIEWEGNNPNAVNLIEKSEEINTSSISAYEVLLGTSENNRLKLLNFFSHCMPLPFYFEDSIKAAELTVMLKKAGKLVNTPDILIAAQAKRLNLTILAKDRDFDLIKSVDNDLSVLQIK